MGIVRLSQFLAKKFPHLFKKRPHSSFTNQIYAVDASNTMYSFLIKTISIPNHIKLFLRILVLSMLQLILQVIKLAI